MSTSAVSGSTQAGQQPKSGDNALRGLDMAEFLNLMIAELQNQDPLNPMENGEILQQISQIREIGVSSQLSDTLGAVLNGQNIASASSLIGKKVEGLTDDGKEISGIVDRVTIADGKPRLHIGDKSLDLKKVREIQPTPSAA